MNGIFHSRGVSILLISRNRFWSLRIISDIYVILSIDEYRKIT